MPLARCIAFGLAVLCMSGAAHAAPARSETKGWSLDEAVLPEGVSLRVEHRSRYEFLNDEFRAGSCCDTDVVAMRTLVHGRVDGPWGLRAGAELQDSRAYQNGDTRLNTTIVNAMELLQGYLEIGSLELFGGELLARGGRITMDVGSRRFVARNRYRNTINGFTGLDVRWQGGEALRGLEIRGFWTLPVLRESRSRRRLLDNDIVFDDESLDVQFWGLFGAVDLDAFGRAELFVFGIHEDDAPDRPTRNRELYTPGFRWLRKPARSKLDWVFETALQAGDSRATPSSTRDLDHFAHFHHLTLGYTFDAPWSPRVALQYDYASGDANPADGNNERFDTLFGARRFDFGPTGIYGPFARSNIQSPGLRIQLKPHARVTSFVAYRGFWLASDQDAWTTTGVVDPSGGSDDFIGSQVELRIRWKLLPGNVMLEGGYAHLFAGDFIDEAPNSNRQGDSDYVYTQIKLGF